MDDVSWKATHIRFKDLEKAAGHSLVAFKEIRKGIPGINLCIGIPYYEYKKYGILKAIQRLGLESKATIYINF